MGGTWDLNNVIEPLNQPTLKPSFLRTAYTWVIDFPPLYELLLKPAEWEFSVTAV